MAVPAQYTRRMYLKTYYTNMVESNLFCCSNFQVCGQEFYSAAQMDLAAVFVLALVSLVLASFSDFPSDKYCEKL